jgi:multiple sugar transport system permease protein
MAQAISSRVMTVPSKKNAVGHRLQLWLPSLTRYIFLVLFSLVMALPFFWLLTTSLKQEYQVFLYPPQWIPKPLMVSNYVTVLTKVPFLVWTKNTLIVTALSLTGTLITTSLVAYGFSRLQFSGRDFWFMVLVSTMMLPGIVTMIPTFILFSKLNWLDTYLPLVVPAWFGGTPFYIFLLRQFLSTIPIDLEEAAYIDGASVFHTFVRIIMPLCAPALGTVGIFSFLFNWNDFMRPMLYLNSPEKKTMAVGLRYFQSQWGTEWAQMMAASALMIVPVLIIFFATQRFFVKGIALTGIAGR